MTIIIVSDSPIGNTKHRSMFSYKRMSSTPTTRPNQLTSQWLETTIQFFRTSARNCLQNTDIPTAAMVVVCSPAISLLCPSESRSITQSSFHRKTQHGSIAHKPLHHPLIALAPRSHSSFPLAFSDILLARLEQTQSTPTKDQPRLILTEARFLG